MSTPLAGDPNERATSTDDDDTRSLFGKAFGDSARPARDHRDLGFQPIHRVTPSGEACGVHCPSELRPTPIDR
jgi:hypothetical protein